jgi:hypothetical protein
MATPLFVSDEATLRAKLRLSAVPASATDTVAIFDEAVIRARNRLYKAMGADRVSTILLTAYTDTPTTDAAVLRTLAAVVETKIVYCKLLRLLPNDWMDASGDTKVRWNEEAAFREKRPFDVEAELERCEQEIADDLQTLCEDDLDQCNILVYDGTPDCPAPRVGLSLRGPNTTRAANDPS